MKRGRQLGLDELMIVNPSLPGSGTVFFGKDGTLYQVQGLGEEEGLQGLGQFFLGEDGTLYQVQGLAEEEELHGRAQFFLGEDSTLYQVRGPRSNRPAELANASAEGLGKDEGRELGRFFLGEEGTLYELVRKRR